MDKKNKTSREAAFESLLRTEKDKSYSNLEIDSVIKRYSLTGAEKGLYTTLVYGAIERKLTLDYIIECLANKPLDKLDVEIKVILRLGLYQLIYLDRVPDSAAVNESVNLAKRIKPSASGFVNALLRGYIKKFGGTIPYPDKKDIQKYLSVRYSCGADVIELLSSYGNAEEILSAFEITPPVTIRVNTLKISRDELLAELQKNDISAELTRYAPNGIKLKNMPPLVRDMINDGKCFIQDEASQISAEVLSPRAGETVIDVCACPGGKSFSAAIKMENSGKLYAFDLHKNKLTLIDSGAKRLGIDIISSAEKNGTVFDPNFEGLADAIICDVPCSGLGVIAKKPEIRYKTFDDISALPKTQSAILGNSSRYLKHGGRICYSTCTLNPAENESIVNRFLASKDDFEAVDFEIGELRSNNGMLTLFPNNGTDGFFISLIRRK